MRLEPFFIISVFFCKYKTGPALSPELASTYGCANLKSIRLQRNKLEGPLPNGLGSLEKLEELDLESNNIGGELPENVSKLAKLQRLRVAHNSLVGALPVHLLDHLAKLKDIRLYHNQVKEEEDGGGEGG